MIAQAQSPENILEEDLNNVIKDLKNKKAQDMSKWRNEYIKNGGDEMVKSLMKIISIRATLENSLFLVQKENQNRVGRSVKKNKLKYFLFYFYFLFFQISKNRVGRISFFFQVKTYFDVIYLYSIAMIQIKDQLI